MSRLVSGALWGLAVFWVGASVFVRGDGVPDWWLPAALVVGFAAALARREPTAEPAAPSPRWAAAALALLVVAAVVALFVGAVSTPSRHWDGAASFDAKVHWLTASPTLQQPFFAAEGVFHHGPDYPLLQSLLVACTDRLVPGYGRAVLPALYLLLCALVWTALRTRAVRPLLAAGVTAAVAVTPTLLSPGGGAVDSGYHDLLLLVTTTCAAAGLLNGRALPFALGLGLAIVSKPEGLPYAAAALAVAFARGERRLLWAGFAAVCVAAITWAPVRAALLHHEPSLAVLWGPPLLAGALYSAQRLVDAFALRERGRWVFVLAWPVAGLLALPWIAPLFADDHSSLGVYMRQADDVYRGLANLPAWLGAALHYGIARLRFGAAFALPLVLLVLARVGGARLGTRSLGAFVLLGLLTTALPFVLSPEAELDHHLRSSMTRLLLHWVGPAWLLTAAWMDRVLGSDDADAA